MATLEGILQLYFHCKVPFRKSGKLTKGGKYAVNQLLDFIDYLNILGIIETKREDAERKINEIIESVDNKPGGIDAYENRNGFFCVVAESYDEALEQIEEHDAGLRE